MTELPEAKKPKAAVQQPQVPDHWTLNVHTSSALTPSVKKFPNNQSIRDGIDNFYTYKSNTIKELDRNRQLVIPQNLNKGNRERGNLAPRLPNFEHYHLVLKNDARDGDLSIVYQQKINAATKTVDLYLTAVGDHKDVNRGGFIDTCNNASYSLIKVLENILKNKNPLTD